MLFLVLAMLVCVAIGAAVVGVVTVEARREGRGMLTPEGEHLLASVRRRSDQVRERGGRIRERTVSSVQRTAK